jgi:hypothetical protein
MLLIQQNLARRICQPNRTESPFSTPQKKKREGKLTKKKKEKHASLVSHTGHSNLTKKALSLSLCSIQIFLNLSFVQTILFLILYFIYLPSIFLTIIVLYIYIKFIRYYHSLPSNYTETRASIWGVLICFGFSRVRVRVFAFAF